MDKSMAKGSAYLIIASVIFITTGYIIHIGLARILGPAGYGIYGVVVSLMSLFNLILTSGMSQAVSKHISAGSNGEVVKRNAIRLQAIFATFVFIAYEAFAGVFASLLGDPTLAFYIRLSGLTFFGYALYSVMTGYFNGLREFKKQAGIQILYSLSKMIFVLGLVIAGYSVAGAFIGFAFAPVIGFLAGAYLSGGIGKKGNFDRKKLIDFAWPIVIFSVALSLLISVDLFSVKSILSDDIQTGYYNASTTVARVPYLILGSLGIALFPVISSHLANNQKEKAKKYLKETLRYLLIILVPLTAMISATSAQIISLLYSDAYIEASASLSLLVLGFGFLTVFGLLSNVLIAHSKTRKVMIVSVLIVLLSIALNRLLIPVYGLEGAALSTTISAFAGMLVMYIYIRRSFGSFIEKGTLLKIILSSVPIYLAALWVKFPSVLLLPLEYLALMCLYVGALMLLGEWKKKDFRRILELIPERIRCLVKAD